MKRLMQNLLRVPASFGLAIVVLCFLLLITVLGTWEQKDLGLYEVQRRYFTSLFVMHDFGPLKLPLPGVYLLLVIFTLNLVLGTILRIRRRLQNAGLYTIHLGMLILLLSALVTHYFAVEGQMTLAPGERSNIFQSYHEWELVITDLGPTQAAAPAAATEYIIPLNDPDALATMVQYPIATTGLPFQLRMASFWRNADVLPKGPMFEAPTPVVNGFFVRPLPFEKENERNLPAMLLDVTTPNTAAPETAILWSGERRPYTFAANEHQWTIAMRRRAWQVPFTVELVKFTRQLHPGTEMAKSYESDILKIEHDQQQPVTIRMNEPLRHLGYTFFQSSFSENPQARGGFNSTFAVVKNPADQWPLYACIVITCGLLLHFGLKLRQHLAREAVAVTETPKAAPAAQPLRKLPKKAHS